MFLFLVRRNNDIDHIAPVIYALADRRGARATVLCQDPLYDLPGDSRLAYLRDGCRARVDYLYRFHMPRAAHRVVAPLLCAQFVRSAWRRDGRRWPGLKVATGAVYRRLVFQGVYDAALRAGLYDRVWAGELLERAEARVVVFDHNPPTRYLSANLLDAARARGIPTVAVPHGTHMLVNELRAPTREQAGRIGRVQIFEPYQCVVVMEPLYGQFLKRMGVPGEKITVLGSARYCAEWREVLSRLSPPPVAPPIEVRGRLKLVYMDKQARDGVHQELIDRELRRVAERPDVALVIKPETRTNTPSSATLRKTAYLADGLSSSDLIRWADAVMVSHSSIAIEVLLQDKTLLHARYFHDNLTMFDEMGACGVFRSPQELDAALDRLVIDRTYRPYGGAAVRRFLEQVVDGGVPGRDVLGEYAAFLAAIGDGRTTALPTRLRQPVER